MKTTLDLPEDLVMEMKLRAVRERRKLKDVATDIFRRGLNSGEVDPEASLIGLLGDPATANEELPLPSREEADLRSVNFS
jgi:plasmid stability protein